MNQLDAIIEEALRSEPLRAVPAGFHGRLEQRLRVAQIVNRERKGLRLRMSTGLSVLAVVAFTIVGVPTLAFYQGWTERALPGAMGYLDYLLLTTTQSWTTVALVAGGVVAVALIVSLLLVSVPVLRSRATSER
jgi:hypothetical protein